MAIPTHFWKSYSARQLSGGSKENAPKYLKLLSEIFLYIVEKGDPMILLHKKNKMDGTNYCHVIY